MKVTSEQDIQKLIADIPFYSNKDSYCLGKTLTEAGEIIRQIVADKERREKESK